MSDNPKLIYKLIYRRFAHNLIHEIIIRAYSGCSYDYSYPSDSPTGRTIGRDGRNLYRFSFGWPEPEEGGEEIHTSHPTWGNIVLKSIFMDDLFLCPDCGQFHQTNEAETLRDHTDWNVFQNKVESRSSAKEFYIKCCEDKNACSKIKERFLKELKSKRESERNWSKQSPASPALQKPQIASPPKVEISDREISVYVIEGNSLYKIGIAADISKRIAGIQTSFPFELKVVKVWKSKFPHKAERHLHKRFKSYRMKGEWFRLPSNEIETLLQIANLDELLSQ
jgi:Meiotically up-regulated gene 113